MFFSNRMKISGTGSYAPEKRLTNKDLEKTVQTTDEWIFENLGIRERRISGEHEFTSDLAYKAALKAIESAKLDKNDIDLIIVATATPDRKAPSTACLVKHKLGITNICPAFDVSAVCSGFLYALSLSSSFIQSGVFKKILIVGADTFSKITDWSKRECVFFGDGAGAVIIEQSDYERSLFSSHIFTDCKNTDNFTVYPSNQFFSMDSRAVYDTGTRVLPEAISSILEINKLTAEDVACVIPHQPSLKLLQKTAEIMKIPFRKFKTNMLSFANTSGATIPLLLDQVNRSGELMKDNLVVFAAVGSGWAWGAGIYRWH